MTTTARTLQQTLTRGQVLALTGLTRRQLDYLLRMGAIRSAAGGGPGHYHRWDLMRVLALAAASRYLAFGASWDRAAGVARFLSGLTVERLEAELAAGRKFPVPSTLILRAAALDGLPDNFWLPGLLIEPPDDPSLTPAARAALKRLEVRQLYDEVRRRMAALPGPAKHSGRRRSRRKQRQPR